MLTEDPDDDTSLSTSNTPSFTLPCATSARDVQRFASLSRINNNNNNPSFSNGSLSFLGSSSSITALDEGLYSSLTCILPILQSRTSALAGAGVGLLKWDALLGAIWPKAGASNTNNVKVKSRIQLGLFLSITCPGNDDGIVQKSVPKDSTKINFI
jgi:hypothetical protein